MTKTIKELLQEENRQMLKDFADENQFTPNGDYTDEETQKINAVYYTLKEKVKEPEYIFNLLETVSDNANGSSDGDYYDLDGSTRGILVKYNQDDIVYYLAHNADEKEVEEYNFWANAEYKADTSKMTDKEKELQKYLDNEVDDLFKDETWENNEDYYNSKEDFEADFEWRKESSAREIIEEQLAYAEDELCEYYDKYNAYINYSCADDYDICDQIIYSLEYEDSLTIAEALIKGMEFMETHDQEYFDDLRAKTIQGWR